MSTGSCGECMDNLLSQAGRSVVKPALQVVVILEISWSSVVCLNERLYEAFIWKGFTNVIKIHIKNSNNPSVLLIIPLFLTFLLYFC